MKQVIYDCDNTMGVYQRDIDDGLVILYLMGSHDVALAGITTTFGNDRIDVVYEATQQLFKDVEYDRVDIVKGGMPDHRTSDAARFLVETVDTRRGEVTILATGALTNLYGAYLLDNDFFKKVKNIIVMGGLTEKLLINGHAVDELNFSCDPEATYHVLRSVAPKTVVTGNLCLQAFFGAQDLSRVQKNGRAVFRYIHSHMVPWIEFMKAVFGIDGFYNWDMVAAVYATHPRLFSESRFQTTATESDLCSGFLKKSTPTGQGYGINLPRRILDIQKFNDVVFQAWGNVDMRDRRA